LFTIKKGIKMSIFFSLPKETKNKHSFLKNSAIIKKN